MLLGKKKRKQIALAQEDQARTFQTTKLQLPPETPIKQQKTTQDRVTLLIKEGQEKKDIFSIVPPSTASQVKEFTPEVEAARLATQTNHQIE